MYFDYIHGKQAEIYSFYMIPKVLFTEAAFSSLSTDAKVLYGLFLDRVSLSIKNNWIDRQGHAYVYYTIKGIPGVNTGRKSFETIRTFFNA